MSLTNSLPTLAQYVISNFRETGKLAEEGIKRQTGSESLLENLRQNNLNRRDDLVAIDQSEIDFDRKVGSVEVRDWQNDRTVFAEITPTESGPKVLEMSEDWNDRVRSWKHYESDSKRDWVVSFTEFNNPNGFFGTSVLGMNFGKDGLPSYVEAPGQGDGPVIHEG